VLNTKQKFGVLMLKMHLSGLCSRLEFLETIFPHMPEETDALSPVNKTYCRTFHVEATRGNIQGQISELKTDCQTLLDRLTAIDLESEDDQTAEIDSIVQAYELVDVKLTRASSWADDAKRALERSAAELN
jgi:hypothetical protein